jgi:hypothetical protein
LRGSAGQYVSAVLGSPTYDRQTDADMPFTLDTFGLGLVLVMLLSISGLNLWASRPWQQTATQPAAWCPRGEVPTFRFGFSALADALGSEIGLPIECEHGLNSTGDTLQTTTTGVARYDWCTNTPSFARGAEHWTLTPGGLEHWTEGVDFPPSLPIVRVPDLRHLCST